MPLPQGAAASRVLRPSGVATRRAEYGGDNRLLYTRSSMSSFAGRSLASLAPEFPPALDHLSAVPVPHPLAKAIFIDFASGEPDMSVRFGTPSPDYPSR
ncbi:hypothetical protein CHELA40_10791 [Chelatococcus asaccharovorans]|nr:hypothetical protein CHELA40_10791 [Chelatococcus asaccharovorans]CAH1686053.1 hypothetical protein CHELA17_64814 [Chelatococcus asaccharovorans]